MRKAIAVLVAMCAVACGRETAVPPAKPAASPPAAAAAPPAAPAPAPAAPVAAAGPRIVFLGDSLTAGYGLERSQAVPALIQARLTKEGYPFEVVNAGVSGDTSAGGVSRLDWSLNGDVRILVVELGANDGLRGQRLDAMQRNLDAIIETCRQARARVLLVGMRLPPNYGMAYTEKFQRTFVDVARRQKVPLVPFLLDGFAENRALFQPDGVHPTMEAQPLMLDTVWSALQPMLRK
jgi:acyl-CoA thioesterase-1